MAYVVWIEDVANILVALASSGRNYGPVYLAALRDVALACGLQKEATAMSNFIIASFADRHVLPLLEDHLGF